jgi:hypothetical protein
MAGRFFRRGKSRLLFAATLASPAAPTSGEVTSATNLTTAIAEIAGLRFSNSPIATPDLASTFTSTIPGEDTSETPSITFYDDDVNNASNAIRVALAKGATGYLIYQPYGNTVGRRQEVWPVTVAGQNDEVSAGNEAARYVVQLAVTGTPTQNATVA